MGKSNPKIEWLTRYQNLLRENDNREDRLAHLINEQYIPAAKESDGSKRNPGAYDRMGNATIRRMEYEEKTKQRAEERKREMDAIFFAVEDIPDPLEREVLRLRYIDGRKGYRLMLWRDVALKMYQDDDEAALMAVYRLHGQALQSLEMEELTE